MVAYHDGDGCGPFLLLVLSMDLPAVPGRHMDAEPSRPFDHVAEKRHVVEAALRILHHRRHVEIGGGVHGVVAYYGKLVDIRLVPLLDDLLDRRLIRGANDRGNQLLLAPRIFETERQSFVIRVEPQGQGAAAPRGKDIAQERKGGGLAVDIERLVKEQRGKFPVVFEMLEQGRDLVAGRGDGALDVDEVMGKPLLQLAEEAAQVSSHTWFGFFPALSASSSIPASPASARLT